MLGFCRMRLPWCTQDTIKAFRDASTPSPPLTPGKLDPQQAKTLGWYPHDRPFLWPAPRDPAIYNTHPLKPSEYRYTCFAGRCRVLLSATARLD